MAMKPPKWPRKKIAAPGAIQFQAGSIQPIEMIANLPNLFSGTKIRSARLVDTTGAGDAWCAGFLYGYANGLPLADCARYGTACATQVIQQMGARIEPGALDDL